MSVIWKYPLPSYAVFTLDLPTGAKILSVQMQKSDLQAWLVVDPSQPLETRTFRILATGQEMPAGKVEYMATFQLSGGDSVFHVFEVLQ